MKTFREYLEELEEGPVTDILRVANAQRLYNRAKSQGDKDKVARRSKKLTQATKKRDIRYYSNVDGDH